MPDIHIGPRAQIAAVLGGLIGVAAVVGSQLPEIRRYLKIEAM